MIRQILSPIAALALVFASAGLNGCATVPATGDTAFTGGLGTAEEVRIGRENHPKIIEEFGGE